MVYPFAAKAQTDSSDFSAKPEQVYELGGIQIESAINPQITTIQVAETALNLTSLDKLLEIHFPIYFKQNGTGMSSTISYRGAGAERTAVYWNGFSIQNAMLGQMDFSLIQTGGFDEISFQSSGLGATSEIGKKKTGNSGTRALPAGISGAIHLNSKPRFDTSLQVGMYHELGSYLTWHAKAWAEFSLGRVHTKTTYARSASPNNYLYRDYATPGFPVKSLKYADYTMHALTHSSTFRIRKFQQISLQYWWQENTRNIPAPLGVANAESHQYDRAHRAILQHTTEKGIWQWTQAVAYFHEKLYYGDLNVDSRSVLQTWAIQQNTSWAKRDFAGVLHTEYQYLIPRLSDYVSNTREHRFSATYTQTWKYKWTHLGLQATTRFAGIQWAFPNVILEWKNQFQWKGWWLQTFLSGGSVSRLPSLNDKYWNPGGNPNLRAEYGYQGEAGWVAGWDISDATKLQHKALGFYSQIRDYIQWRPTLMGFWAPLNYKHVAVYGLENELLFSYKKHTIQIHSRFFYQLNFTRNLGDALFSGKSLPYAPVSQAGISAQFQWKNLAFQVAGKYQSQTFTNDDNSQKLAGFFLGDITLQYQIKFRKWDILCNARVQNFSNTEYYTVPSRPLPGIQVSGGLGFRFHTANFL